MKQHILFAAAILATLASMGQSQAPLGSEESIRTVIRTFADARNSHDGQTVANLYSEDGEWIASNGRTIRGRPGLADLWGSLEGKVQRTVESIDFAGPNIAVARVVTQYLEPIGRHHETFIFVKETGAWKIRVHQSVD
jgi:uncharacterized protein (TIGR02246 family)